MQISQLTNANLLFQLEQENFKDFYSLKNCQEEVNNNNKIYFCAYQDNQAIGYVGVMLVQDQAEILRIAVNKSHRRKGVAKALLEKVISYLKTKEVKEIFLEVSDKNISAINFYQTNNFKQTYIRKNYYSDNTNAIIMQRSL